MTTPDVVLRGAAEVTETVGVTDVVTRALAEVVETTLVDGSETAVVPVEDVDAVRVVDVVACVETVVATSVVVVDAVVEDVLVVVEVPAAPPAAAEVAQSIVKLLSPTLTASSRKKRGQGR